jgi:hypothetical protein
MGQPSWMRPPSPLRPFCFRPAYSERGLDAGPPTGRARARAPSPLCSRPSSHVMLVGRAATPPDGILYGDVFV